MYGKYTNNWQFLNLWNTQTTKIMSFITKKKTKTNTAISYTTIQYCSTTKAVLPTLFKHIPNSLRDDYLRTHYDRLA